MELKNDIVFVIGAGASKDICPSFGTGVEMFHQILNSVAGRTEDQNDKLNYFLMHDLNVDYSDIVSFVSAMENYRSNVITPSFDEFMSEIRRFPEFSNNRDKFEAIGQFALVRCILKWEAALRKDNVRDGTWLHMLIEYIKERNLWDKSDHIKIITFNYDRVIEYILLQDGGTYRNEILSWCDNNIVHAYGYLAPIKEPNLYAMTQDSIPFGDSSYRFDFLKPFIQNLKLQYDDRADMTVSNLAADIIANAATKIAVFGFGFDFINCRHLGLNQNLNGKRLHANLNPFDDPKFIYRRLLTSQIRSMQPNAVFTYNSCTKFVQDQLDFKWKWSPKI